MTQVACKHAHLNWNSALHLLGTIAFGAWLRANVNIALYVLFLYFMTSIFLALFKRVNFMVIDQLLIISQRHSLTVCQTCVSSSPFQNKQEEVFLDLLNACSMESLGIIKKKCVLSNQLSRKFYVIIVLNYKWIISLWM